MNKETFISTKANSFVQEEKPPKNINKAVNKENSYPVNP